MVHPSNHRVLLPSCIGWATTRLPSCSAAVVKLHGQSSSSIRGFLLTFFHAPGQRAHQKTLMTPGILAFALKFESRNNSTRNARPHIPVHSYLFRLFQKIKGAPHLGECFDQHC